MNRRFYIPDNKPTSEDIGIISFNHGGSSIYEDAGRDAQVIASKHGIGVLAVDRPGSGLCMPSPTLADRLTRDYVSALSIFSRRLNKIVENRGWQRVMLIGRSAGGLGALGAACTEQLPATHLFAAEPMGWRKIPRAAADAELERYQQQEKQLQTQPDTGLILPVPSEITGLAARKRIYANKLFFLADKYHNAGVLSSDAGRNCAIELAVQQPSLDLTLEFATISMAATNEQIEYDRLYIPSLRSGNYDAPLIINQTENTTHASYNNRKYISERMSPSIQRFILGSA